MLPWGFEEVIRVEDIRLKARTTVGVTVVVRNVAFSKRVVVRYSFDGWRTWTECEAGFFGKVCPTDDTWDRFVAEIDVDPELFRRNPHATNQDSATSTNALEDPLRGTAGGRMFFAVRYESPGAGEWWDNNRGRNFEVVLRRRARQNVVAASVSGAGEDVVGRKRKEARKTDRVRRKELEWEKCYGPVLQGERADGTLPGGEGA
ncbi:carbohydrate-binding module family 21 protein [Gonapodya prolifera JEL478]|uniref:Carbohydrate-binding module family 21 protein n=1 Tax=Gonapodya prolifera (strain JEL478) TaxID=1344416 RepID=A0A139AIC6_GONPJ|nr:carbohydrate-binding module family 21 protein [Gonapodya prolifera JEL478]|eukprot:KXS16566.1 carbohydrate-binding module family 21 protein [Gonapodya prolifera JEL478]